MRAAAAPSQAAAGRARVPAAQNTLAASIRSVAAGSQSTRIEDGHSFVAANIDFQRAQCFFDVSAEVLWKRGQQSLLGFDQDHPCRTRIDAAKVAGESGSRQFGDVAGELYPGRAAANDHKRQQAVNFFGIARAFSKFESA